MVFIALVLLGGTIGIRLINVVFVPFMQLFYLTGGFLVIILNTTEAPTTFGIIFEAIFIPRQEAV